MTLDDESVEVYITSFVQAIQMFHEIEFIVTKSNADQGGARINDLLDDASKRISNMHVFVSLGVQRYLSLMKYAEFVIGNSSSGIIEVPSMGIPTVDIGPRQRGRVAADSVIHCRCCADDIADAISEALARGSREDIENPYYKPDTLEQIVEAIVSTPLESFTKCTVRQ